MNQEVRDAFSLRRKVLVLELSKASNNVSKICKEFSVSRSLFYIWKGKYDQDGIAGLVRKKPIPKSHPNQLEQSMVEKFILYQ